MNTAESAQEPAPDWVALGRKAAVPAFIFVTAFLAYYLSVNEFFQRSPALWYDHYDYLAKAILHGTLNVDSTRMSEAERIPAYFQDAVTVGEAKYLPFPPAPAILLLPFVALFGMHISFLGTQFTTEAFVSLLLGATNVVVFWYILDQMKVSNFTKFIMVPFFAFVLVSLWYNAARFDTIFDTGYKTVYDSYGGVPYSYYLTQFPQGPRFDLFDVRNIPLHLHAMLMLPPEFHPDWSVFRPSPYGTSVLFTSPLFIYAFLVRRKSNLVPASWLAIALISVPIFLHYSQGWVQFGYRFLLDFAPFLLLLTALGVEEHNSASARRWQVALLALSVVAGFWGRYWANQLGW